MQKKKGISLIVLVITIIVMIILAAAIIISISNSGIVNRANEAVDATNEAQMKQMVTLAWSEAFFKDTTETKDDAYYLKEVKAYLLASGITELTLNKYTLTANKSGANIQLKEDNNTEQPETPNTPEEPTITQLSAPTIAINENTLVITDNATNGEYTEQFEIYVGNELKQTVAKTDVTALDITTLNLGVGEYSITVKAIATGLTASSASNVIEYIVVDPNAVPAEWAENVVAIVDGVPIPKGFAASPYGADEANGIKAENTKNGGLVIYELEEGETAIPSGETQFTSWTTRNQYVWVPVDKDNFATEFVRKDFINQTSKVLDSTGAYNALGTSSVYWEVIVDNNNLPKTTIAEQSKNYMSTATLAEVQAMYASVKEYGGFYIARYEAGIDTQRTSNDDAIVKTLENVHSKMNKIPYNYIGWATTSMMNKDTGAAVEIARSLYPSDTTDANYNKYGVISTLTYGVQWDRTLQWIIDTEALELEEVTNTKGTVAYANCLGHAISSYSELNSGAKYTSSPTQAYVAVTAGYTKGTTNPGGMHLLTTGALKASKINNIYDLAGNMAEWTMEGMGAAHRVPRGGGYNYSGALYVSLRADNYGVVGGTYSQERGFRPSLYIKQQR